MLEASMARPPGQPRILTILGPRWRSALAARRLGRDGLVRLVLFALLGAGFWLLLFGMTVRVLHVLTTVEFGALLARKVLDLLVLGCASILVLSNLIAALSAFFLARDLDLLVAAPLHWFRLYVVKIVETTVHASWMVLLLALPVLAGFGVVYHGGPLFPFVVVAALVPFLVICSTTGAAAMLLIVNVFPARRARDLLGIVTLGAAGALIVIFRLLQPELLIQRGGVHRAVDALAGLHVPASPFLPTTWVSGMLMNWLQRVADPLPVVLLATTAGAFVIMGGWLHGRLYRTGFSLAQEGADRLRGGAWRRRLAGVLLGPLSVARRELLLKDVRLFFRDPTQWGQLILLVMLVAVYVFNIRALPIFTGGEVPIFLVTLIVFLNLGLAGFVVSAVAVRFAFPAISLEGRQMWLLRSSPLDPRTLIWSKFAMTTIPLVALAVAITLTTDLVLHASAFMLAISLGTIVLFGVAASALALTFGTYYPQFETENAAQIPTSFGGMAFMMTAICLLGVLITVEAVPVASYLRTRQAGQAFDVGGGLLAALASAAMLCIGTTVLSLRLGLRRAGELEW